MANWYDIFIAGNYGFFAQLIPLIFIIGLSWYLSRKPSIALIVQFPLVLSAKFIFPFFYTVWVIISFALLLLQLIASRQSIVEDIKHIPKRKNKVE